MNKRWEETQRITQDAARALDLHHPILQQLLFNRGFTSLAEANAFLAAEAPGETDPFLLSGMEAAVDRILQAVEDREPIAVYGDYDADGVTATALMMQTLTALGADTQPYLPNRFDEGYGINIEALETLHGQGVRLVISVDCGIRAIEQARYARSIGLDLVITDHHNPGAETPDATAVINPRLPDQKYSQDNLAGVGTAYKLACALAARSGAEFDPGDVLDLVALGTVADLVPLTGENRHLVRAGLEQIRRINVPGRHHQRQGLLSLMRIAGVDPEKVTAADIGFRIGPRLNAAGRLDTARAAYDLLMTEDVRTAGIIAQELDNQNRERQEITRKMQERADEIAVAGDDVPFLLFAADESFNEGVVGLTASRLTEKYYRPAIVGRRSEDTIKASCRSIREFHITNALDACADLLEKYGGHAAAAGFTVKLEQADALIERLQRMAVDQLAGKELLPELEIDAVVSLEDLSLKLLDELELLQPTGKENPEPLFASLDLEVRSSRKVGRDQSHLKLTIRQGQTEMDAIAFRQGGWHDRMPERIDLAYHFEKNEYRGRVSPQLNVRDIRATRASAAQARSAS